MNELFSDAFNLMALGMGTVFVFLTVLVVATTLMSKIIALLPEKQEPKRPAARSATAPMAELDKVAAVAAAVYATRNR